MAAQNIISAQKKHMNEYYRHFRNGKLYRFVTFATIEATGEEAVVYQAMYGDHRYWIRPRANFFEEVGSAPAQTSLKKLSMRERWCQGSRKWKMRGSDWNPCF